MKNLKMNKQGKIIVALVCVVVILLGFISYSFIIRPSIDNYVVSKQSEAQEMLISALLNQVQQLGYVQIPVGENQTLVLVPYVDQQANQESAQ